MLFKYLSTFLMAWIYSVLGLNEKLINLNIENAIFNLIPKVKYNKEPIIS